MRRKLLCQNDLRRKASLAEVGEGIETVGQRKRWRLGNDERVPLILEFLHLENEQAVKNEHGNFDCQNQNDRQPSNAD